MAMPSLAPTRLAPEIAVGGAALLVVVALQRSPRLGLLAAVVPIVLILLTRPHVLGMAGLIALPLSLDLGQVGPVIVGVADLLLSLAVLGLVLDLKRDTFREIRAVARAGAVYGAALAVAVVGHLDLSSLVNGAQRLQLIVMGVFVGVAVTRQGGLRLALTGYVSTAALMAGLTMLDAVPSLLQEQKNPLGQFIAGGLLIALAQPTRPLHAVALPILTGGLLMTESRGSILGLMVGIAVLVMARPGLTRLRALAALLPLAIFLGVFFAGLPDDVQERTTTFSAAEEGVGTSGEYTIKVREEFRADALEIIARNPVLGVGVGNYLAGSAVDGTLVSDPHNVLLFEAAEGGLVLLAGLLFLVAVTMTALWRCRRSTPWSPVALAVMSATLAHALVDIYWVRGTPVLGWFLVGAALADAHRRRSIA